MSNLHLADNLTLPTEAVTQVFTILARRGAGKTHTASVLAEELLQAGQCVIILDPLGVWWGLRLAADGVSGGLPIGIVGGDHGDLDLDVTAGATLAQIVADERIPLVLDLSRLRMDAQLQVVADFAEELYHRNRQPLHLIVDDADRFALQQPRRKGQDRTLLALDDLARRGRVRGVGLTVVMWNNNFC